MSKLFVDTNVFIYDIDKSSKYNAEANKTLNSVYRLFTTTKNISEFFAVLTKMDVNRDSILAYFQEIKENVEILYPDRNSLELFENLIRKYEVKGNQVYDLVIVSIILSHNIKLVSTFNRKDFSGIKEVEIYEVF
ncbi:type II toxin-antitoxin system VapC family toxin [Bacteroidota bacterium]